MDPGSKRHAEGLESLRHELAVLKQMQADFEADPSQTDLLDMGKLTAAQAKLLAT